MTDEARQSDRLHSDAGRRPPEPDLAARVVLLEEALRATERALEAAHHLANVYAADLHDQVEPAWVAYEIARAALAGDAPLDARLVAAEARVVLLEEALRRADFDIAYVVANGGFDSTRRELGEEAILRIRAALAGGTHEPQPEAQAAFQQWLDEPEPDAGDAASGVRAEDSQPSGGSEDA